MRSQPYPGPTPFGRPSRELFCFDPNWTPLNHGSYGTIPAAVAAERNKYLRATEAASERFKLATYLSILEASRAAVAPLLGAHADEVVFVPNATTGINTVFRNLPFQKGDVVLHFTSVYNACLGLLQNLAETVGIVPVEIPVSYPIEDEELVSRLETTATRLIQEGKSVRVAIFDTVTSGPGVRVPWEALVAVCRTKGILSVLDAAHGIGHLDLTHLGTEALPDFAITNCHKWLYCPRGCAVLYVPFRNQHYIKTSLPTSHGYEPPGRRPEGQTGGVGTDLTRYFQTLFVDVATFDNTTYCVVPFAIQLRRDVWGGEETIREYCQSLAQKAAFRAAEILGTEVLSDKRGNVMHCCLSNVRLPIEFGDGAIPVQDGPAVRQWFIDRYFDEYNTYIQTMWDAPRGQMWVRLSGQVYLTLEDFEWGANVLLELCKRLPAEWASMGDDEKVRLSNTRAGF
ncbi:aminotransferase family protein [Thozetella sp. PMI_491]|nr:aminotransferase family protein [Thozetella sp. PMI_491]